MSEPRFRVAGTVLCTRDPGALAAFYERLLGWPRLMDEDDWIVLRPEGAAPGTTALSFQRDGQYVAPTWPSRSDEQQMMMHVDFVTDDLDAAVEHAVAAGADLAEAQPSDDERVLIDPDGHPFCLIRSPNW